MSTEHIQQKISRLFSELKQELNVPEIRAVIAPPKFYCPPSSSWAWRRTTIPAAADEAAAHSAQSLQVIEELSAELKKAKQREALQTHWHNDAESEELAQLKKNEVLLKSEIARLQNEVLSCAAEARGDGARLAAESDQRGQEIERLKKSETLLQEQLRSAIAASEASQASALRAARANFKEQLGKKEAELFELTSSTAEFLNKAMAEPNQIADEKNALEKRLSLLQKEHEDLRNETHEKQMRLIDLEEKVASLQRDLQAAKRAQSAAVSSAAAQSAPVSKSLLRSLVNWLRKPVIKIEHQPDEDEE
jgi:chromosome segregation ATPase